MGTPYNPVFTPEMFDFGAMSGYGGSSGSLPVGIDQGPLSVGAPDLSGFGMPSIGGMGGPGGGFGGGSGFGFNVPTAQVALSGLNILGSLFAGFKSLGLAKKQFKFQKEFANANLANQMKTYNTALEDRSRSRAKVEDQTPEQAQAYVDRNRLTRTGG
jgi:hypothetical protein